MPTEEQRSDRPPQVVPQGVLALRCPRLRSWLLLWGWRSLCGGCSSFTSQALPGLPPSP